MAHTPTSNQSSDAAIEAALRLAPTCAGVWAYSQNVDVETDSADRPRVLVKIGSLPPGLKNISPNRVISCRSWE